MAKKKKAGAGHQDVDGMTKAQIKAYYKEICDFYLEHGWRDTLSQYALSPKQAKEITAKVRAKKDKAEAAEKAKRKQAKAKKKSAKAAAPKKKAAPKKVSAKKTPKKKAAPKARKSVKKAPKIDSNAEPTDVLDFLLSYRGKNQNGTPVTLDEVIIDLTTQVRAA